MVLIFTLSDVEKEGYLTVSNYDFDKTQIND